MNTGRASVSRQEDRKENSTLDYKHNAHSTALKIRWISVQCYEMVLPNGKVIVTDPFYWDASHYDGMTEFTKNQQMEKDVYAQTGFDVEQFTGAEYILLNHVHGDHSTLVGQLWNKFYGRVLVPGDCAMELARTYDIPYAAIYPLYPGNTYYFDDFTLKVYPGAHDNRAFREGKFKRPSQQVNDFGGSEGFGVPCPNLTGPLGSIHNLNFLIETPNNFRIDFSAGRDYQEHLQHVAAEKPNLMLRHRIRSYSPETYAGMIEQMGAQLCMPLHHNNARATGEDLNAYFEQVNQILQSHGSPARAFNPEPYKWYSIRTSILDDEA